ncbi:MAG: ribosomal-protein-alanine N-acetyltransferase [Deltaproteobacteria bacterium HGW-Deltaproteobacteria-4]|nr:MAG: ribosomal-protein-alanine N-acetyltransferase [Deltaproteobacteria bacterium HGW-Deltaproteobacteria-4]
MMQSNPASRKILEIIMFTIRPLCSDDLPRILAIERQCHAYPWSEEIFHDEMKTTHSRLWVAVEEEEIAGFLCWWTISGEIEIQNIATALRYRRSGVGRCLLAAILAAARAEGINRALLEVRVSNLGAIKLYREFGFIDCCTRRCYYADGEDALLMELPLSQDGIKSI